MVGRMPELGTPSNRIFGSIFRYKEKPGPVAPLRRQSSPSGAALSGAPRRPRPHHLTPWILLNLTHTTEPFVTSPARKIYAAAWCGRFWQVTVRKVITPSRTC